MQLDPGTGSGVEGITKENFEMRDKTMWTRAELLEMRHCRTDSRNFIKFRQL